MADVLCNLDTPSGAEAIDGPLVVSGWLIDANDQPARAVRLTVGGIVKLCARTSRPDVKASFADRALESDDYGFRGAVALPVGAHEVKVEALLAAGTWLPLGTRAFTVTVDRRVKAVVTNGAVRVVPPRLEPSPTVLVSILFYFREDLALRCVRSVVPQLEACSRSTGAQCVLALTLNYPASNAFAEELRQACAQARTQPDNGNLSVEIINHRHNLGFGAGHNHVFAAHQSDLFVLLNSDVRMEDNDWLTRLVEAFAARPLGLAGLQSTAAKLRADGCGIDVQEPDVEGFDFVDGSLFALNSELGRTYGVFNEDFQYFYFEDADLCLRYRQLGLVPELFNFRYQHDRSSSALLLPRFLVGGVLDYNRARFFEKWGDYLRTRELKPRILLRFRPEQKSLQAASLPAILALLRDHPGSTIDLYGIHPVLRPLFALERVTVVDQPASLELYGRTLDLDTTQAAGSIADFVEEAVGCKRDLPAARRHLQSLAPEGSRLPGETGLILAESSSPLFQGAAPDLAVLTRLVRGLKSAGAATVATSFPVAVRPAEWGDALSISADTCRALLGALASASWVFGFDTWIVQLAQILDVRVFVWCGATAPRSVVWNHARSGVYVNAALPCLGCNHALGTALQNLCIRSGVPCMDGSNVAPVLSRFHEFISAPSAPAWLLAGLTAGAMSRRTLPSTVLDLSRWRESLVSDVVALVLMRSDASPQDRVRSEGLASAALKGIPGSRVVMEPVDASSLEGSFPQRQAALARARQEWVRRDLAAAKWVFTVDPGIVEYPENMIRELALRAEGGIAAPLVLRSDRDVLAEPAGYVEAGSPAAAEAPHFRAPGPVYELDAVGGCYLVSADVYRLGGGHQPEMRRAEVPYAAGQSGGAANRPGQGGQGLSLIESYRLCQFARAQGLPVRAFGNLIVRALPAAAAAAGA